MQEEQQTFLTRYFEYVKKNKYKIFVIGAGVVLLGIIVTLIIVSRQNKAPITPVVKVITQPTNEPVQIGTTTAPSSKEASQQVKTAIVTQTKPQLDQIITIQYTVDSVKSYDANWGVMTVNNPDTDPARVVVHKVDDVWKVVLGPGTHFDADSLKQIGAPLNLVNDND